MRAISVLQRRLRKLNLSLVSCDSTLVRQRRISWARMLESAILRIAFWEERLEPSLELKLAGEIDLAGIEQISSIIELYETRMTAAI